MKTYKIITSWDSDDGVGDSMAKIGLSRFLHSFENHRTNFLWCLQAKFSKRNMNRNKTTYEFAIFANVFHIDHGAVVLALYVVRQVLEVAFDFRLVHLAANETLRVEYCVFGI